MGSQSSKAVWCGVLTLAVLWPTTGTAAPGYSVKLDKAYYVIASAQNIVWGTGELDTIVSGTMSAEDEDTIVWRTMVDEDNIVWGTSANTVSVLGASSEGGAL